MSTRHHVNCVAEAAALRLGQTRREEITWALARSIHGQSADNDDFRYYFRHVAAALEAAPVSLEAAKAQACAEAYRRYDGDTILDETTGEPTSLDDWGYAECQRAAFIAGFEWRSVSAEGRQTK